MQTRRRSVFALLVVAVAAFFVGRLTAGIRDPFQGNWLVATNKEYSFDDSTRTMLVYNETPAGIWEPGTMYNYTYDSTSRTLWLYGTTGYLSAWTYAFARDPIGGRPTVTLRPLPGITAPFLNLIKKSGS